MNVVLMNRVLALIILSAQFLYAAKLPYHKEFSATKDEYGADILGKIVSQDVPMNSTGLTGFKRVKSMLNLTLPSLSLELEGTQEGLKLFQQDGLSEDCDESKSPRSPRVRSDETAKDTQVPHGKNQLDTMAPKLRTPTRKSSSTQTLVSIQKHTTDAKKLISTVITKIENDDSNGLLLALTRLNSHEQSMDNINRLYEYKKPSSTYRSLFKGELNYPLMTTLVHIAIDNDAGSCLTMLLNRCKAKVSIRDSHDIYPLNLAVALNSFHSAYSVDPLFKNKWIIALAFYSNSPENFKNALEDFFKEFPNAALLELPFYDPFTSTIESLNAMIDRLRPWGFDDYSGIMSSPTCTIEVDNDSESEDEYGIFSMDDISSSWSGDDTGKEYLSKCGSSEASNSPSDADKIPEFDLDYDLSKI
jgi:hypothetical protein